MKQPRRRSRRSAAGFTLVELMVVVTIVGVLATIGIVALRKHVMGSRTVEALTMIQSIRAAQERWRAEHMTYLDVSDSNTAFHPTTPTKREKRSFHVAPGEGDDDWHLLNPTVTGPVEFGYLTRAGDPGETMTPPAVAVPGLVLPTPTEHWYVIQAICDADGDNTSAFFMATSLTAEVYRQNEGE